MHDILLAGDIIKINSMFGKDFNPNTITPDNGCYFGLSHDPESAALVLLSAPWDTTTSLRSGSSYAPDAIIEVSRYVDFYEPLAPNSWQKGIATAPIDYSIQDLSHRLRSDAERVINLHDELGMSVIDNLMYERRLRRVNEGSVEVNNNIFQQASNWLSKDKIVGLVGGDQSVTYGIVRAMGYKYEKLGLLHIDSKCDMREAFQGFDFSHASTMFNIMRDVPQVDKLVSVGVQEFSPIEWERVSNNGRIKVFTAQQMWSDQFEGTPWSKIVDDIIAELPDHVYISLDIDGLMNECSPNKGHMTAGGLNFHQVIYLMDRIITSGRRIVGFDLTEVSPNIENKADMRIVARLLFKMCSIALKGVDTPAIM